MLQALTCFAPASPCLFVHVPRPPDACSTRKVRCDAASPKCDRCTRLNLTCEYTRPEKKRGPPRGTTSKVHARLRALESLVADTLGVNPNEIDRELGLPPNRTGTTARAVPVPRAAGTGSSRSNRRDSPPESGHSDSSGSPEAYIAANQQGFLPPTPEDDSFMLPAQSLGYGAVPIARQNSTSSSSSSGALLSAEAQIPNIFSLLFSPDMNAGDTTDVLNSSSNSETSEEQSPARATEADLMTSLIRYTGGAATAASTVGAAAGPIPANVMFDIDPFGDFMLSAPEQAPILLDLIEAYFARCAPFVPILHRPTFLANPTAYPPLLLYAMYSYVQPWAKVLPGLRNYQDANFFELARRKISPLAKPDLRTLQALVLIVKSSVATRKLQMMESDTLLGMAVNMVRQLRLDIPNDSPLARKWKEIGEDNAIEAAEAERTTGAVWVLDIYHKALLDRSLHFGPEVEEAVKFTAPFLMEMDPEWIGPIDRAAGPDPVSNVRLFLAARDSIALNNKDADEDELAILRAPADVPGADPNATSLQATKFFSNAHTIICHPPGEWEELAIQEATQFKQLLRNARLSGLSSRIFLCGRALTHSTLSMILAYHGGHDFSEFILDLEAALMAVGPDQFLELGSPYGAWWVARLSSRSFGPLC